MTGGGSGIGAALARRFAAEGARVVVNDLDAGGGRGGRGLVRRPRRRCAGDAASEDGVAALIAGARAELGEIDLFCANAGIARAGGAGRRRGGLGGLLAGQRDGARPGGAAAARALAGARQRPPDLHGLGGRAADHARLGAVLGHQARARWPSPSGWRSATRTAASPCRRSARWGCGPRCWTAAARRPRRCSGRRRSQPEAVADAVIAGHRRRPVPDPAAPRGGRDVRGPGHRHRPLAARA